MPDDFCPYVGLQPYTAADREYFFGRERDQRIIASNLYASSLTILYGESGVGKSSVLLAGVAPYLRIQPRTAVVVFREWQRADFVAAIKSACIEAVELAGQKPLAITAALPLDDLLCKAAQAFAGSLLILFDQFEEYFLYHPESDAANTFDSEFARAVNREDVDAGFLIAIREDALSKLDRFRERIPNLLSNTLRLQHLGAADAEAAIRRPLDVFNARASEGASAVLIEDELVRSVLLQVRTGQVSLGQSTGVGQAQAGEQTARIEAPFLQLVMMRLWKEERSANSHTLRLSTLERLGGAQQIVASHLDSVMGKLDAVEQEVCSRFFDRLVTPSGAKIACGVGDLTRWAGDLAAHVPVVLQTLSGSRLLRGVAGSAEQPQAERFEIFHDVLAPAVLAWRARYIEGRERAEAERRLAEQRRRAKEQARTARRLRALSAGLLAVLVLALSAAGYAWVQREQAEKQSRLATARYLAGETRLHLHDRLDLALLLGLEAERLADTEEVRSSLVGALLANPFLEAYFRGAREFTSVAFSPDGKTLAAGGVDSLAEGRVILWDVNARRPVGPPLTVPDPGVWVTVALSPDGRTLAANSCGKIENGSCKKGEIRLWDMASHEPSGQPLKGHTEFVRALAFSPDGKILASASLDGTLIFWDVALREPLGPALTGHRGWITSLAFSPDGKTLASAGCGRLGEVVVVCRKGEIRFWNVATREPLGPPLSAHDGYILSVAFSPDGKIFASSGSDGALILWDAATRQALGAPLRGHAGMQGGVAFSPDGTTLASGSTDNSVVLWDVATRQPLGAPLAGHTSMVRDLAFSPDGKSLASASSDGSVILWDLGARLRGHAGRVTSARFSPDGKTLVAVGEDNTLSLWDVGSRRLMGPPLTAHNAKIAKTLFSPDNKVLASVDEDGNLMLWDAATRLALGPPLTGHSTKMQDLDFSPDGRILASPGDDQTVVLWDVATRQPLGSPLSGHDLAVAGVEFSPDGKTLLSTGLDGAMILWNVATREPLGSLIHGGVPGPVGGSFSPDGGLLVSGKLDGTLMLWDVATRQALGPALTGDQAAITSLDFGPDGKTFVSINIFGTVVLWDVATRQPVGSPFTASTVGRNSIQFSPDGEVLAVIGRDNKASFWGASTRRPLGQPISGEDGVALSKDFKTVASLGNDGILLRDMSFLADASRRSWQARACAIANRNLTRVEWRHYFADEPYRATCPGLPLDEDTPPKPAAGVR